jgi:hypothetical protein
MELRIYFELQFLVAIFFWTTVQRRALCVAFDERSRYLHNLLSAFHLLGDYGDHKLMMLSQPFMQQHLFNMR